jgi:pimeloyl-ACP methyl ester carboxylesterase
MHDCANKEKFVNTFWRWTKRILVTLLILIVVLTALIYAAGAVAKAKLVHENPPPGKLVDIGGYHIHLYCQGEGSPTVILESGLNDFSVSWAKIQPEVAKATRVCSYDRAGLGWSETSPQPRTSDVMAEELHEVLNKAGINGPYILVGHSFGGIIVRAFAHRYSDKVAGMLLVDSSHEAQNVGLSLLENESAQQEIREYHTFALLSDSGLMALLPANIPQRGLPDEAYAQYQAVLATTDYFNTAIAETTSFYFGAPSTTISGLEDLPLIVISHGRGDTENGEDDPYQNQLKEEEWTKMQAELAGLSSQSEWIIAQNSGHYIQLDQPQLVIDSILELVKAIR